MTVFVIQPCNPTKVFSSSVGYHILISKTVLQVNARKYNCKITGSQMPGILP